MKHLLHGSAYIRPLCAILCVTGETVLNENKDVSVVYSRYCLIRVLITMSGSGNA